MKICKNNAIPLSDKQLELIERFGVFGNEHGIPPAAARISALLIISDKLELTFDEIRETLNLSKSATSNGINFMLLTRRIAFVTKTGDRKRYFKSNVESWKEDFSNQFQNHNAFCELLKEIEGIRTTETPDFNQAIEELHSFIHFFLGEIPKIYQKWETQRKTIQ
ncbi:MAG TPA: MarR family transcriptional regulator [Crocinitomicaceae bacterium]|nr:MarR family transcriptional regulator [Crocinitomicaceae bacterium]